MTATNPRDDRPAIGEVSDELWHLAALRREQGAASARGVLKTLASLGSPPSPIGGYEEGLRADNLDLSAMQVSRLLVEWARAVVGLALSADPEGWFARRLAAVESHLRGRQP